LSRTEWSGNRSLLTENVLSKVKNPRIVEALFENYGINMNSSSTSRYKDIILETMSQLDKMMFQEGVATGIKTHISEDAGMVITNRLSSNNAFVDKMIDGVKLSEDFKVAVLSKM
jgi:hypothetical protein